MRRKIGVTLAAVLGLAGVVGGLSVAAGENQEGDVTVAASGPGTVTEQATPAPEQVLASSTTTSVPASTTTTVAPTTTSSAAPTTTTTTRPATTTTTTTPRPTVKVRERGWSDANLQGTRYFEVLISGSGCSGTENGWSFTVYDPAGQPFNGDGGQATTDGNWEMKFSFHAAHAPGRYAFKAACSVTNGPTLFSYDPVTYHWAGTQ